jgi:hypothetical protein
MINKAWSNILKEDIENLVLQAIPEGHTLDYKEELPNESSKSKFDFLVDVSALANASGGDLVFGIKEKRIEGKPTAIPEDFVDLKIKSSDEVKRRLENLIRSGIEPTLSVMINHFDGLPKGPVIVVRVPPSWNAPHMVTLYTKDLLRPQFHRRHNGGNHPMDISEIRAAFALSENRIERIRRFRDERLSLIQKQDDSVPRVFGAEARVLLHLLPVAMFQPTTAINISKLEDRQWGPSAGFPTWRWVRRHFNFDGFLIQYFTASNQELYKYVQVFRSGAVEAVEVSQNGAYIDDNFEVITIRRAKDYLKIQRDLEIQTPIFVMFSLLGVKDYPVILPPDANYSQTQNKIDRVFLPLPECVIEDFDTPLEKVIQPAFDALYQSAGMPRSFNYDESGNWIGGNVN